MLELNINFFNVMTFHASLFYLRNYVFVYLNEPPWYSSGRSFPSRAFWANAYRGSITYISYARDEIYEKRHQQYSTATDTCTIFQGKPSKTCCDIYVVEPSPSHNAMTLAQLKT